MASSDCVVQQLCVRVGMLVCVYMQGVCICIRTCIWYRYDLHVYIQFHWQFASVHVFPPSPLCLRVTVGQHQTCFDGV